MSGIIRGEFEKLIGAERLRVTFETLIHETKAAWAEAKATDREALAVLGKPKYNYRIKPEFEEHFTEEDCFSRWLSGREKHLKPREVSYSQAVADIGTLDWRKQSVSWGDPPPSFASRMVKQTRYSR